MVRAVNSTHQLLKGKAVKRSPLFASILSLVAPGAGQMYAGEANKGAAILAAAIVIGNLNIIILPLISMANPETPLAESRALWAYWIPRVFHDILSFWSIAFWLWAVWDAYVITKRG